MELTYTKITDTLYKFFYEGEEYGEFYMNIKPDGKKASGTAEVIKKDPQYKDTLLKAFEKVL